METLDAMYTGVVVPTGLLLYATPADTLNEL